METIMKTCNKCGGLGNISGGLDDKGYITYHTCDKCNGRGELYPHEENCSKREMDNELFTINDAKEEEIINSNYNNMSEEDFESEFWRGE
jgi:DnaJ-class molecular chaperone